MIQLWSKSPKPVIIRIPAVIRPAHDSMKISCTDHLEHVRVFTLLCLVSHDWPANVITILLLDNAGCFVLWHMGAIMLASHVQAIGGYY